MTTRLLVVFGTRPEAIKMAPVVHELRRHHQFLTQVCVTAQHRQMLDQVLAFFEITPDYDLDIMQAGQDLFDVTTKVLMGMRTVIRQARPDYVLVHGDTTTCMAASLAAFYEKVKVVHVEAGLRTGDLQAPFPEEANRVITARLANLHFAPTRSARENLLREGVDESTVTITGNTVIDALFYACEKLERSYSDTHWQQHFGAAFFSDWTSARYQRVLITGHRRENFGEGIAAICHTLASLAARNPHWYFTYPVHLNPNIKEPVDRILGGFANIKLMPPQEYDAFVWLMANADVIVTDSGGIQEEAPSLGKPVLVTREVTERPEAVEAGTVKLVGTQPERLAFELNRLLTDASHYQTMSRSTNPYGDGLASQRIVDTLAKVMRYPVTEPSLFGAMPVH